MGSGSGFGLLPFFQEVFGRSHVHFCLCEGEASWQIVIAEAPNDSDAEQFVFFCGDPVTNPRLSEKNKRWIWMCTVKKQVKPLFIQNP